MNDFIKRLETLTNLQFYFIERPQNINDCVVYNYKKSAIVSDGNKESSKYQMYLVMHSLDNVNRRINKLEDALFNCDCIKITVNSTVKLNNTFQTSVTATKIIN